MDSWFLAHTDHAEFLQLLDSGFQISKWKKFWMGVPRRWWVLALPEGGWIGLALVRRAALAAPRLRGPGAGWLEISMPESVQPPPVGAGGRQSGGESSGGTGT